MRDFLSFNNGKLIVPADDIKYIKDKGIYLYNSDEIKPDLTFKKFDGDLFNPFLSFCE